MSVGRRQRQGRERDDGAAAPRFALAASDDRDPRGQRSHRMSKVGAVGVAQAPVAHARASTRRRRNGQSARDSRLAKA